MKTTLRVFILVIFSCLSLNLLASTLVDVNLADVKALSKVSGIGKKRAQAITTYREEHGAFKSLDDLIKVKGISQNFIKKHRQDFAEISPHT